MKTQRTPLRGPILIVIGIALLLSPLAIEHAREQANADAVPGEVTTAGGAAAACNAKGVNSIVGRLGCDVSTQTRLDGALTAQAPAAASTATKAAGAAPSPLPQAPQPTGPVRRIVAGGAAFIHVGN
ncbi:MAG: hypothetical protein GC146_09470 [Limimaricola sp.]|uniref:hypothetical protein n=1 Tax=Limimaricola sp. TaxID=2211665 RepID=UPI001D4A1143|nr:hypothetical protein [Limimaricola sp.]MBI1417439.1 hypothetical protein [Limimaricola sp.]